MMIEMCTQEYGAESCYITFDGEVWYVSQGKDGAELAIHRGAAAYFAEFLRSVVWHDTVDRRRYKGRPFQLSGRYVHGGDYAGLLNVSDMSIEIVDDPTKGCWGRVRIREEKPGDSIAVHFDADEAWLWLAAIESSEKIKERERCGLERPKGNDNE